MLQAKKIHQEIKKEGRLSDDPLRDVMALKRVIQEEHPAVSGRKQIPGFIQEIGADPFFMILFCQEQLNAWIEVCQDPESVAYWDATGSLLSVSLVRIVSRNNTG